VRHPRAVHRHDGKSILAGTTAQSGIRLIEPNKMFEDRLNQVDIRFTKIFRFGRTRIQGMFDIYNVFNANTVLVTNTRYGPSWLQPATILGPRLFKLAGQFEF